MNVPNLGPELSHTMSQAQQATFGGGCFWCTEAVFKDLRGVEKIVPGYAGGTVEAPTYEQVCAGHTGHAEAVQIEFDPDVISYLDLLDIFFRTHDPTTPNRQGNDVGTQYRSVIFYHDDAQRDEAERVVRSLSDQQAFDAPVVTEIVPFTSFYEAEPYHHDYFAAHPNQGYCRFVIAPKMEKFRKAFQKRLKPGA